MSLWSRWENSAKNVKFFCFFFACLCAHSTWPGSGGLFNVLEVLFFLRGARYRCYKPATTAGLLSLDEKTETNIALSRKANPSLRNTRTHVNLLIFFCTDILITPPSCSFVPVTLEEEFTRGGIVSPPMFFRVSRSIFRKRASQSGAYHSNYTLGERVGNKTIFT